MAKNQVKAKQYPEAKLLLFENYTLSSYMLSSKTSMRYSKKCAKNWKWKMDHDINRNRPRHENKYTK